MVINFHHKFITNWQWNSFSLLVYNGTGVIIHRRFVSWTDGENQTNFYRRLRHNLAMKTDHKYISSHQILAHTLSLTRTPSLPPLSPHPCTLPPGPLSFTHDPQRCAAWRTTGSLQTARQPRSIHSLSRWLSLSLGAMVAGAHHPLLMRQLCGPHPLSTNIFKFFILFSPLVC